MPYGVLSGDEIAEAVVTQQEYLRLKGKTSISNSESYRLASLEGKPRIHIDDFNPIHSDKGGNLGPNSYDLNLAPDLLVYDVPIMPLDADSLGYTGDIARDPKPFALDMRRENPTRKITIPEEGYTLTPGRLYLAKTKQYTETFNLVPSIDGRSSTGRLGLFLHISAGKGDVGFRGAFTCELLTVHPLRIYPNAKICQISYQTIKPGSRQYAGRYQGSRDVVASRFHLKG